MPVRTRDWLKFGTLVAIAFVFGLAFASTLNLPKKSGAAETALSSPGTAPPLAAPGLKAASDWSDAFVAGAEQVKPPVGFIRSQPDPGLHVLGDRDESVRPVAGRLEDRKSTRLNSSPSPIS